MKRFAVTGVFPRQGLQSHTGSSRLEGGILFSANPNGEAEVDEGDFSSQSCGLKTLQFDILGLQLSSPLKASRARAIW
ncbi:hypothetical protein [Muribaculum intestinale]|uniref:hypothetical protein n=1 Tax=Muribaculum intestinale TaxID=1796646 RepID=UPI003F67B447